jgi:2Fe-2S ferredoxin
MIGRKKDICFSVFFNGEEIEVATFEGEFRNLMVLINEKLYVEDFGECKGIGRCGTCLVIAEGMGEAASMMERNEKSTLQKCTYEHANLRLSCQIMINDALRGARIQIVDDRPDVR